MNHVQTTLTGGRFGAIGLTELEGLSGFKTLLKHTTPIMLAGEEIFPFLEKRYELLGPKGMVAWYNHPVVQKYARDRRYQFIIIDMPDGDEVLLLVKDVRMNLGNYLRLTCAPISIDNNINNMIKIMEILKTNNLINQIYYTAQDRDIIEDDIFMFDRIADFDYFCNINERFAKIDIRKWRKRHKINQLLNNGIYTTRILHQKDADDMLELRATWEQRKNESIIHKRFSTRLIENIGEPDIVVVGIYMNCNLVAFQILLKTFGNNLLAVAESINRDKARQAGNQLFWVTLNMFNDMFSHIYAAGGVSGTGPIGLLEFKQKTLGNRIEYLRTRTVINDR